VVVVPVVLGGLATVVPVVVVLGGGAVVVLGAVVVPVVVVVPVEDTAPARRQERRARHRGRAADESPPRDRSHGPPEPVAPQRAPRCRSERMVPRGWHAGERRVTAGGRAAAGNVRAGAYRPWSRRR
jgi:hypothetical protein